MLATGGQPQPHMSTLYYHLLRSVRAGKAGLPQHLCLNPPSGAERERDGETQGGGGVGGKAGSKGRKDLRRNAFPSPAVEHVLVFLRRNTSNREDYRLKLSSLQPSLSCSPEKQQRLSSLPSLFSLGMLEKPAAEKEQPKLTQKMQRRCIRGGEERQDAVSSPDGLKPHGLHAG